LLKIGHDVESLLDSLSEPDFGDISKKFKGLISQNILYKTLSEAGDILEEAGSIIANAGDYIENKISSSIDDLKSLDLEDIISAPFDLAGGVLSEINDQINKNICNGNLLKNLLKGTIIVKSLLDNVKKDQKGQQYVAPPTDLTINNKSLKSSVITEISSLSGTVTDKTIKESIKKDYTHGGPWDLTEQELSTSFKFSLNDPFLIKSGDMKTVTDNELKQRLLDKYKSLYESIEFETKEDISKIKPVNSVIKSSKLGDYIFNIGITGDTSHTNQRGFYESEITLVYGVNKRLSVPDDKCGTVNTTKMILINKFSFSGLGNTLDDSRYNAFLECQNKTVADLVDNKQSLISTFSEHER
jgi:hypothetical protein